MENYSFYQKLVHHPWKVIGVCLLGVFFIGSFMRFVAPSVTYKDMLGADYPLLQFYEDIQSEYTNDDNLLVYIEAKQGTAFTREILAGVKELTRELWQTPHSVRVDSVTNFQHTEARGDDLKVADLVEDAESLTSADLWRIKNIALSDPLLLNKVVNEQGYVLAINISFAFPNLSLDEKLNAEGYVQNIVEKFRNEYPQTNAYVAGLVALDATVMKISQKESGMFLVLVMLVVVVLLMLILRSVQPVLVSILVFIFSVVAGVAFSGMMGWKLTPFTASVPMVILILAVADCVHFITSFMHRLRSGEEKRQALVSALELNFKPIAVTSITTAIGFLTLNLSESGGIRALGNEVAVGVMVAFMLSVTFLPAVLSLLPIKANRELASNARKLQVGEIFFKFRFTLLLLSALLSLGIGYGLTLNEFNDSVPTYIDKSVPWRQANDFGEAHFGGAYTFSFSIKSGQADGVTAPEFLQKIDAFSSWLRGMPQVISVNTVTDTFKRLNKSMHGDDPSYYRLPQDKQLAAQYLLLYEMSLPYGLDLNNQINLDKSATKILVTFKTLSTTEVLAMEQTIDHWIENNMPGVSFVGSGVQLMFAHLLNQDTRGLTLGAVIGLLVISLLLILAFRSFRIGLVSIAPNLFPAAIAFGVWGYWVGEIGMGMAMVSGMTIGIIVDDTVHFLSKYLKGRREEALDAVQAVNYAFRNVVPSIVFTTIVLVAGFLLMAVLSDFRVNSDMGKMTSMILFIALIFDLVTLPVLLMIFDKQKVADTEPPEDEFEALQPRIRSWTN
jgi:uncharacterized protein